MTDFTAGLIALGANLHSGEMSPEISVPLAMQAVADRVGGPCRRSRLFHTPAFPEGPRFVNAAMSVNWTGTPQDLLNLLHDIEAEFGRTRTHRWEARVMDLDLIGLDDVIAPDAKTRSDWAALTPEQAANAQPDQLILPHPRLAERGFVLVPLADVAPDWVDPATGRSVAQMLADRPEDELAQIQPIPAAGP